EKTPHGHGHLVAQSQILLHLRTAQVQVAVFKPHHFREVLIVHLERRRDRGVQDFYRAREYFDLAGHQVRIHRPGWPATHQSGDFHDEFTADFFRDTKGARIVGIAHDLDQALPITQIDENYPAMIAPPVHPSIKGDALLEMAGRDQATVFGTHNLTDRR